MPCDTISIYINIFPFCIWKNSWRRLCIIQKLKQLITLLWIFVKGDEKRKFKISPFWQFISYLKQILARKTRLNIGMHFNILASKTADIINATNIKSTQNNQDQDKVIIWYCKNEPIHTYNTYIRTQIYARLHIILSLPLLASLNIEILWRKCKTPTELETIFAKNWNFDKLFYCAP